MVFTKEQKLFFLTVACMVAIVFVSSLLKTGSPPHPAVPSVRPPTLPMDKRFPGPWVDGVAPGLAKALVVNGVSGCPYLKHKASVQDSRNYLVQCSGDERSWRTYMVWVVANEVREIAPE